MTPYDQIIGPSDASDLIPEEHAADIISLVPNSSAALSLFRHVVMSSGTYRQPVLATLPIAYWVSGATGLKQTTKMSWDGINLIAEELATIMPIPEVILDDSGYPLWDEARPWLAAAIGKALDEAVFEGTSKPASWPEAVVPGAIAAGNEATQATPADQGGIYNDINDAMTLVENDGYDVNGFVARRNMKGMLRGARDTTGQKLLDASTTSVEGETIQYVDSDVLVPPHLAVMGDFTMGLLGVRQDITFKVLDQAVITDTAGKVILNLAQQDAVALRVVARFAFAVANPGEALANQTTPYPFSLLSEAAAPPGTQSAQASSSKASSSK